MNYPKIESKSSLVECCTTNGVVETQKGKALLSFVEHYLEHNYIYNSCKLCSCNTDDLHCLFTCKETSTNNHTRHKNCPLDNLEDSVKSWYNGTFCNGFHESDNDVAFANYLLELCK